MSRLRLPEFAGMGQVRPVDRAAWIQPVVAAGSLVALLLASGARAGEVSATQGPLDLGTRVNGVAGGRCQAGHCEVSGGTAAGANLFHRFNRFDTRGEISGVSIQNGLHRTVVLGVLDPLGSFLNQGISLSSPAHLFFLSPGGLHVGAGAQFFNTPQLTLSTASSLGLGGGRFDVFRTTAAEAALLTGMPIRGTEGLSRDPAEAQRNGITNAGDLVVDGGLIQVDAALLLDAQGGHLLLQAGSQLAVPGGSVEMSGNSVTVAAGALVTTSAQAPAAPFQVSGPTTAPAPATVVPAPAVVATGTANPSAPALSVAAEAPAAPAPLVTAPLVPAALPSVALPSVAMATSDAYSASATPQTPAQQAPAAVVLAAPLPDAKSPAPAQTPAGLDGGVIRISAVSEALVSGQLKAQGVAATARGTVASVQAGKGGRIEVTGQRVALTGAALDASGPAGGGTVLLGGDAHGANPAMPNTSTTTVDGASTVRADALAKGDGGTVVAYANQRTEVAGLLSVRGGPAGGNGGFVETSGASVALSRGPDLAAPLGKGGTWLIDPVDITITSTIPDATTCQAFFTGANGAYPAAALTAADRIGLYYGTTAYGGDYGHGAIYAFDSITGSISLKGSFTDTTNGAIPFAALTAAGNGLYYGTTYGGGANGQGAIYAFDSANPNPATSISLKGSFKDSTNGAFPSAALTAADRIGLYYGTTATGGEYGQGAIYAFDSITGSISLKGSFTDTTNGAIPFAALTAAGNGLYYGTTYGGGANGQGAIYAFDSVTGSISLKGSFTDNTDKTNGASPSAGLTAAGHGLYYGTTLYGGEYGQGAIYAFDSANPNPATSISLKGSFTGNTNGAIPFAGLTAADHGLYYGTTYRGGANDQGAIYAFDSANPNPATSISLKGSFKDSTNGAFPSAALTAAGNGLYYGTTENGGEYGQGAIYAFDANSNSYVSTATIQSALNAGGDVIVDTTNALGSQAGNITVNSPINKTAGGEASLSLNAHNNIALNSNISSISAALNLNLNADIDANGSGATSLASGARLSLNSGTATANGPINMAANSMIKDAQIVAPAINSDGGILENNLYLNVDSLRLNGGSLQANGKAIIKALDLSAGSITGSGDLQITQSFMRTGGSIAGNFSNLAINHASGSLIPGALSAAGPVALLAKNGQLNLNAPISASTVLARGSSGITLSSAAVLTATAPLGRAIIFDAGSGPFSNNSSAGPAALSKQPGATWAIYADNPTSTPRANLGGLAYNFKQYNQTFDANQGSNPVLGSGNGLFLANIPMLSVSLLPVSKVYDSKIEAILSASNYNVTGVLAGDLVAITAAGAFDNKNAGTGKLVSVKGLTIASATESASGVAVYGYNLSSTEASGAIGTITPLPLTGAAIAPGSSIYGSVLTPGAVNFGNIVGSDEVIASTIVNTSTLSSSGKPIVGTYSQSASALTGVDAGNYSFSGFTSAHNYSISRAPLTPSFTIKDKPFDGNSVATIAGYNLQGVLAGDDVSMAKASAAFDNASVGKNKPVAIDGFSLSGSDVNNYQLSSSNATATASITARTIVPPNEEPIKKNHGNPGVGLQSAKISSLSNLRPVEIDSSNVSPSASVAKASIATLSGPDLFPSTPTESAMSADSAAQGLLESDQRSAEEAIIGLDLSDAGAGEAMSTARLQQLMQSAADLIRRYPVRMLNP